MWEDKYLINTMTATKSDINITNSSFYRVGLGIGKGKSVDIASQKKPRRT